MTVSLFYNSFSLILLLAAVSCTGTPDVGAAPPAPAPMTLQQAIERVRPAVAQIALQFRDAEDRIIGRPSNVMGSAFLIRDDGVFATADHVVKDALALTPPIGATRRRLLVGYAMPDVEQPGLSITNSFMLSEVEVVGRNPSRDVALLKTTTPFAMSNTFVATPNSKHDVVSHRRVATLATDAVADGEQIATSGYPLAEVRLVTTSGYIAGSQVNRELQPPFRVSRVHLADLQANYGNSGGPTFRVADAAVIGLISHYQPTVLVGGDKRPLKVGGQNIPLNSGLTVIVPASEIVALAEQVGIDLAPRVTSK